jgi:glycosyltransferase involved in cell wall biosynthesis
MNFPKISIITPSFNQGKYIEQTILSVINQNYPNLEYIIIDGGSTDETVEIIKKYEKHITFWLSEQDRGQSHAINKGLQKATGELFNWLNSDDYLKNRALFDIAEKYLTNKNPDVICGFTHCFFEETGKTSHIYRMGIKKNPARTITNVEMNQPGTFYNLQKIKKLGGVNESLNYIFDDELWFRFLSEYGQKNIVLSDKIYVNFRLHGTSKSVHDGFEKFLKERNTVYLKMSEQMNLPDFIIKKLSNENNVNYYKTNNWDFKNLDKEQFEAWFCNKYQYNFYKDFKYKEAEYCVKKVIRFHNFSLNIKFISLFVKLFLIPSKILSKFRKV